VPHVEDLRQAVLATDGRNFVDLAMALQGGKEVRVSPKKDDAKGSPERFDESSPERTESFDHNEKIQREENPNPSDISKMSSILSSGIPTPVSINFIRIN